MEIATGIIRAGFFPLRFLTVSFRLSVTADTLPKAGEKSAVCATDCIKLHYDVCYFILVKMMCVGACEHVSTYVCVRESICEMTRGSA